MFIFLLLLRLLFETLLSTLLLSNHHNSLDSFTTDVKELRAERSVAVSDMDTSSISRLKGRRSLK